MKKRILSLLLATVFSLSLFACGDSSENNTKSQNDIEATEVDEEENVEKPEALKISIDDSSEHDINVALPISLEVDPFDADTSELSYEVSGGVVTNENGRLMFIASEPGTYTLFISCNDVKSNTLTIVVEDIVAKRQAEEAQRQAEEAAAAQAAAEKAEQERIAAAQAQAAQTQGQMVWISATGSKYHNKPNCGRMDPNNATQMTMSDAQSRGYEACKKCY